MPQNVVGSQIRKLRYGCGLSQATLAARCGVQGFDLSRGTLAKIEAGIRCVSDVELWVIAKSLRVPLERLYPARYLGSRR